MEKKVMDALEAVADEMHGQPMMYDTVIIDRRNLHTLLTWALGQRIHLQFGEEVGLKIYEVEEGDDPEAYEDQPSKGTIAGFAGKDGVLVDVEGFDTPLYYDRSDVKTL